MIKNSGELIALAQPLVFIDDLIHLLVEFGGGKYQRYKWLKWHNTVVSYLVALCRASSSNSLIGLAMHLLSLYSSKLIKTCHMRYFLMPVSGGFRGAVAPLAETSGSTKE